MLVRWSWSLFVRGLSRRANSLVVKDFIFEIWCERKVHECNFHQLFFLCFWRKTSTIFNTLKFFRKRFGRLSIWKHFSYDTCFHRMKSYLALSFNFEFYNATEINVVMEWCGLYMKQWPLKQWHWLAWSYGKMPKRIHVGLTAGFRKGGTLWTILSMDFMNFHRKPIKIK